MRGYIDENDKKNEIRLLFRHPLYKNKAIVVVEGKSDIRLFRSLLNTQFVSLETFDGKPPLLSAMAEMISEYPDRLFAICDADYIRLCEQSSVYEDNFIFLTDYHDAELMLVNSSSLNMYIDEYSSPDMVEFFKSNLFEIVMDAAYPIGIARWLNTKEDLGLRFDGLNFRSFVDIKNSVVSISEKDLIDEILRKSTGLETHVTADYLFESMRELAGQDQCRLQINCGHDVTKIISMIYQNGWASIERNMDQRKVESALRIGYRTVEFTQTQLYVKLNAAFQNSGLAESIC